MKIEEILAKVDHTLLSQTATWEEIKKICDDGMKYKTASVCIPASYVKRAKEYVGDKLPICTVIGFPNGYSTTETKCFETADAVKNGADEIDMVINIGWLKDKKYAELTDEIKRVKAACGGKILKVIIETCLLSDDEKIEMCRRGNFRRYRPFCKACRTECENQSRRRNFVGCRRRKIHFARCFKARNKPNSQNRKSGKPYIRKENCYDKALSYASYSGDSRRFRENRFNAGRPSPCEIYRRKLS